MVFLVHKIQQINVFERKVWGMIAAFHYMLLTSLNLIASTLVTKAGQELQIVKRVCVFRLVTFQVSLLKQFKWLCIYPIQYDIHRARPPSSSSTEIHHLTSSSINFNHLHRFLLLARLLLTDSSNGDPIFDCYSHSLSCCNRACYAGVNCSIFSFLSWLLQDPQEYTLPTKSRLDNLNCYVCTSALPRLRQWSTLLPDIIPDNLTKKLISTLWETLPKHSRMSRDLPGPSLPYTTICTDA